MKINTKPIRIFFKIMRISIYQLILSVLGTTLVVANDSGAQELLNRRISLDLDDQKISVALRQISRQAAVRFMYSPQVIPVENKVTLHVNNEPLSVVLASLFKPLNIGYEVLGNQLVLSIITDLKPRGTQQTEEQKPVDRTIKGSVKDERNEMLPGVNVVLKGTQSGTITDADGRFELAVPDQNAVLLFSFVGFISQEVDVANKTSFEIRLVASQKALDEVVVVGYGTQKKTSVTAAVSTMKGEEIASVPTTNLSNNLGGRLSGVIVKQASGEPGKDGSSIFIRGISTTGSTSPLLVVDGIPRSFDKLDPNSIETITVLKDAAAVAPYGVAGANGVVLITTKKGKSGKASITYNGYIGFQNPTALPKYVNSVEFATLKNTIAKNEGLPSPYSDDALRKFADGSDPDVYSPDEILDFVITKNAPLTYHNLEMTGGTDRIKYYAGFGYQYQQGMWNTTSSNRYNLNLNIEAKASKYTTVSLNLTGRISAAKYPNSDQPAIATSRILELIGYAHPGYGPAVFSNGAYGRHVMPAIFGSGYLKNSSTGIYSQLNIEQQIPFIDGLKLRGTVAYDPTFSNAKGWALPLHLSTINTSKTPYEITSGIFGELKPSLSHNTEQSQQFTYQAGFDYLRSFGKSNISLLGLFEARANDSWSLGATRRNYNLLIDEISMGSSSNTDMTTSGTSTRARQLGLVYRVAYDYAGKYLVEASGRYDGHYFFAPDKRFGFFPAFSVGWRMSEEKFIKDNLHWLSNLKIRASYGEVGALAGSAFQYLSTYGVSGPGYVLAGNAVQIVSERAEPNPNITWERAKKTDIGVEFSLLNGAISIEADYFKEKRSNMLVAPDVVTPTEYGVGLSQVNAGIMENRGIDLSGNVHYKIGKDFTVSLGGTFTYAKNKLIQTFENTVTFNNPNRRRTGRPLGTQFGYNALGYFQQDNFDDKGVLKPGIATQPWGAVRPGDIRYQDMNGDGRIDPNDEVAIGDPNQSPRIVYGFSPRLQYKNWSLDVLFQGAGKTSLYHANEMSWAFFNGMNAYKENLDYWKPDNTDALHPRLTGSPTTNNTQGSSFWMRDASYLRMKNATLSFRLPAVWTEKVNLQLVRLYASGQNIFTWSKMEYWDPESTFRSYPQQKVVSFGVNVGF